MRKKLKLPLISVAIALLLAGLGTAGWFIRPQEVMNRASEALQGSEAVEVEEIDTEGVSGFHYTPWGSEPEVGLIFYPGARVPVRAYAPEALKIAEEGYEVFLVSAPLNLAVLGWKKAGEIITNHSEEKDWVIGGHSMGGAMAARFVVRTDYSVEGLLLWASYPQKGESFSTDLKVLSIIGGRDEIINESKVVRSREQLPPDTEFVEITGGNHSQFGWYGFQSGDGKAGISREKQMKIIVEETVGLLAEVGEGSKGS
ncbi:alpha/beta hydrolase [Candidatus Bipolaricaulota bacterium]|nr:alpha/beta hydrolase [Candidatus Bipolaricaulota bacterium]